MLSAVYVAAGDTLVVTVLFAGLAPAVLAIVARAVLRVSGRALGSPALIALAVAAFLALAVFAVPFPRLWSRPPPRQDGRWDAGPRRPCAPAATRLPPEAGRTVGPRSFLMTR